MYLLKICFYSFQVQSLESNYILCYAEALAEKVLSHQPTQAECKQISMDDDGKQDADFETLANMQASRFRFRWWRHQHEDQKTIITPRPKRKQ